MRTATLRREFLMRDRRDTRVAPHRASALFILFFLFPSQRGFATTDARSVRLSASRSSLFFLASCLVRTIANRNPEKYRVGVSILWHLSFFQHRRFIARDTETPAVYK